MYSTQRIGIVLRMSKDAEKYRFIFLLEKKQT